ncbi:cytochrome P450 [Daldinia bambusicola]|nr:cytochrome P450 [Daldinia bambusicola]
MAQSMYPLLAYVAIAIVFYRVVFWYLYPGGHRPVTKKSLQHIPEVRYQENDTYERYLQDSRTLLLQGYDQYLKHGKPFQMRNPIGEYGPQVMLPMTYLDEVKSAPMSLFSFRVFSEKMFFLNYSGAPQQTDAATHVIKVDLNRNLGNVVNGMWEEAIAVFDKNVPSTSGEWTSFNTYDLITKIVSQVMAIALVGPELCRNEEWLKLSVETTFAIFGAANSIRNDYTPHWRWLARYQSDAPKQLRTMRAKAVELLRPVYTDRLDGVKSKKVGSGSSSKFADTVYWLLGNREGDKSLAGIANQELFLTTASIHTTSGTLNSILFDWLANTEYHEDITAEVREVVTETQKDDSGKGRWDMQRIAKLRKLDSFMKESARMHPIGFITTQRYALKSHTFNDGLHVPAGTIFQFPADGVHHDADIYPEPHKFDAYRFLHMRETIDPNRFHFASVSETSLNFGAGSHACPGRFISALAIKLVMALLMTRYEIKWEDESIRQRPNDVAYDFNIRPDPSARIALRRKA